MSKAAVYYPEFGSNNADLEGSRERLAKSASYRDLSTVCIIPSRGMVPARVMHGFMNLIRPMNQKFAVMPSLAQGNHSTIVGEGLEVGAAYSHMIDLILADPVLSKFQFVLTLEEDNVIPPDALLKLLETMYEGPWAAVGALYWTKGEGGQPMIYGDPKAIPLNMIPQQPVPESVQECRGLGMGCTLFQMELFRDPDLPRPLFRTLQDHTGQATQDLYFFHNAAKLGYRFACDTRVRVGHLAVDTGVVW